MAAKIWLVILCNALRRAGASAAPPVGRNPVSVRRVAPSDLGALYPNDWHDNAALRSAILSQVAELAATDLLGPASDRSALALQKWIYTDYLRRFAVAPQASSALLVAEDADGAIVGSCCCGMAAASADGRRQDEPALDQNGWQLPWARSEPRSADAAATYEPRALLDGLVVRSRSRRAGIGRALVSEAEALARSWGHASLLLRVEASNAEARAFYARLGYARPAGCAEVVAGRKLVTDGRRGCTWVAGEDAPLERAIPPTPETVVTRQRRG